MADPSEPLSDEELQELDRILLHEVDSNDSMVIDTFDGFLHAIAIGPTTLHPKQWLPKVWGMDTMLPPMKSTDQLTHVLGLVMRHFNGIISGFRRTRASSLPIGKQSPTGAASTSTPGCEPTALSLACN
jgi:uncharacterized protein